MKTSLALGPVMIASVLALTGWGCFGGKSLSERVAEKVAENVVENAIEKESGGKVDVDFSDGNVTYKAEDGTSVRYGSNVSLPPNFPSVVPIYKDSNIIANSVNGNEATATMTSSDKASDILSWYELQLNGWTKESSFDTGEYYMRVYAKGVEKITLSVAASDGESTITAYYQKSETK